MNDFANKDQSLAHDAEMFGQVEDADISAANAQTYALLAIADELRALREQMLDETKEAVLEEVSSALMDARPSQAVQR